MGPSPALRGSGSAQQLGLWPHGWQLPGWEPQFCRSVTWGTGLGPRAWGGWRAAPCCRRPGTPVHQAGPSAHGQARVWSEAGEGPELWRSPPPSPVGTALTLAGLGHAERRGRGRGGRPQTSVEREPNCKIQRQEPPDCRWGPVDSVPPALARLASGASPLLASRTGQWPVAERGDGSSQSGSESRWNRPARPHTLGS